MVRQPQQAESNLRQLIELCGNTIDRTNQYMQHIEQAYLVLAEGTRYVYDQVNANEEIAEVWVHSELAHTANAYQTLAKNVWQAIVKRTTKDNQRQICQATQLARVNDVLAFQGEANTARGQHLATFQVNVELWVADHQRMITRVEEELQQVRDEIRRIATQIPLLGSPNPRALTPELRQLWHSPARPSRTSAPTAPNARPLQPARPSLGSPIQLPLFPPTRRVWPPAIPTSQATPPSWRNPHGAGNGGPPSSPPS